MLTASVARSSLTKVEAYPPSVRIAIGTRKGLWLATDDHGSWQVSQPLQDMAEFASVAWIPRPGDQMRLLAGARSWFWGPTVMMSDDGGATWTEPASGAVTFPPDTGAAVERIWTLEPDPATDDVVWAGAEPHSLWRSTDGGASFELNRALWDHPHRPNWMGGAGGPAIHNVHRRADGSTYVAMTGGGVYRSADGLAEWAPANRGISASFMPDPDPEYGQCVHRLAIDAANPDRMYVQNHGGVFRSDDGGVRWAEISDGLPESEFGFVVLAHPSRGDTVWVIPIRAETMLPADGDLLVWKTEDAGATWSPCGEGLPSDFYAAVLRDAAHVIEHDGAAVLAFGTRNGLVFVSTDEGVSFTQVADNLPDVLSLRICAA